MRQMKGAKAGDTPDHGRSEQKPGGSARDSSCSSCPDSQIVFDPLQEMQLQVMIAKKNESTASHVSQ